MKKIPIFTLSILTAAIGNFAILGQDSFALYQENDVNWWTVDEMLEFSHQVDVETTEICGTDTGCRQELYFNRLENDEKFRALDRFYQTQFHIASINPEKETMEVLFLDQNPMLRQMGIDEHYPLDYIFMAWFNQHNLNITNYYYAYPDEAQFPDDLHIIYSSGEYQGGAFPSNQKFTLPINHTGLRDNPLGRIYLATFGEQYNSKGSVDYVSCLRAPDYTSGTECRLMFSADNGEQYMPPRETPTQNNDIVTLQTNDGSNTSNSNDNNFDENSTNESNVTPGQSETQSENPDTKQPESSSENSVVITQGTEQASKAIPTAIPSIKTPETGDNTMGNESAVEFPWWLGLIVVLNFATLLWLFWPSSSKNRKNHKKTIDRIGKLR